eukprot:914629_1
MYSQRMRKTKRQWSANQWMIITIRMDGTTQNRPKRKSNKHKQNRLDVKQKTLPPIEDVNEFNEFDIDKEVPTPFDDDSPTSSSPTPTKETKHMTPKTVNSFGTQYASKAVVRSKSMMIPHKYVEFKLYS